MSKLAISDNRPRQQSFYRELNERGDRHFVLASEEWRICLLYDCGGGFHHRTIAKYVYGNGNPRYRPTDAEVARVGRVLIKNRRRTRDWRNGKTPQAREMLSSALRKPEPLRIAKIA